MYNASSSSFSSSSAAAAAAAAAAGVGMKASRVQEAGFLDRYIVLRHLLRTTYYVPPPPLTRSFLAMEWNGMGWDGMGWDDTGVILLDGGEGLLITAVCSVTMGWGT